MNSAGCRLQRLFPWIPRHSWYLPRRCGSLHDQLYTCTWFFTFSYIYNILFNVQKISLLSKECVIFLLLVFIFKAWGWFVAESKHVAKNTNWSDRCCVLSVLVHIFVHLELLVVWMRFWVSTRFYVGYAVAQLVEALRYYPSGRTMSLGSTQPLTEMSTRYPSWG